MVSTFDRRLVSIVPWFFAGAGLALGFVYVSVNVSPGESGKAALTLLSRGYIGDPYLIPTGPTAHVSPTLAVLLASVFDLFGGNTSGARILLSAIAALAYGLSVRAALQLCIVIGADRAALRMTALLFLSTGWFLFDSVITNRQWDQPMAALILIQSWLSLETYRYRPTGFAPIVKMGLLSGIGALFSPSIFPSLLIALGALIWSRRTTTPAVASSLLAAGLIAACLLPWGLRNRIELGHFIITRSNFGLELAIGNAPGALGFSGSGSANALHPHDSLQAAEEVRSMGEVAYMQEMTAHAKTWIGADPSKFVSLSLKRAWLTFFPSVEMTGWRPLMGERLPWVLLNVFGAMKLGALLVAPLLRTKPVLGLVFSVLPLAPYFVTHVNLRYEFVTYFPSIVIIALAYSAVLQAWSGRVPRPTSRGQEKAPSGRAG